MNVPGIFALPVHGYEQYDRVENRSFILTAIRIASLFATAISAAVFLRTGSASSAFICGISLLTSILTLGGTRRQRPLSVVVQPPPNHQPQIYQQLQQVPLSTIWVESPPPVMPFTAPQPYVGGSRRDQVAIRAAASAPQPSRTGRDTLGGRSAEMQQAPLAAEPPRRDVVGGRTNAAAAPFAPPSGGRDIVGGRRR